MAITVTPAAKWNRQRSDKTMFSRSSKNPVLFSFRNYFIYMQTDINNVVSFLLGNSPTSEFYMPTFQNTLSVPSSEAGRYLPMKMEQTECSEMSAYKIQMQGNYPEESLQNCLYQFTCKYNTTFRTQQKFEIKNDINNCIITVMINVGTTDSFIKMTRVIWFQECFSVFTAFMKYKFNTGLSTVTQGTYKQCYTKCLYTT